MQWLSYTLNEVLKDISNNNNKDCTAHLEILPGGVSEIDSLN